MVTHQRGVPGDTMDVPPARQGKDQFPRMETLPEKVADSTPALNQAALFADPDSLLTIEVDDLRKLATAVGQRTVGMLEEIRRYVGLLAWAGWHRIPRKEYTAYVAGLAQDAGVSPRTVETWRDDQLATGLSVPGFVKARKRLAADKTAGQGAVFEETSNDLVADPVIIETTATESPVAQKAVGSDVSKQVVITGNGAESMRDATKPDLLDNSSSGGVDAGSTPVLRSPTAPDDPKNPERLPSLREVASAWFTNLQNTEEGFAVRLTAEEITYAKRRMDLEFAGWAEEHRIPVEPKSETEPEKRRSGYKTTPADRAKAKLAEVIVDDPDGVAPDSALCKHPREKRKQLPYFTLCTDCGRKVA